MNTVLTFILVLFFLAPIYALFIRFALKIADKIMNTEWKYWMQKRRARKNLYRHN